MKTLCEEFCLNSSLHGIHYLVARGSTLLERVMWAVLLLMASVVMGWMVQRWWVLLYEGPVMAVVEDPHYDVSLVDFPAVTICPNSKAVKRKVHTFSKSYVESEENLTAFENSVFAMSLVRFPFHNLPYAFAISVNQNLFSVPSEDIFHMMREVGADLDDVVDNCQWRSTRYDCKNLFRRQVTLEGFCFSFNSKTAERSKDDPIEAPPIEMPDGRLVSLRSSMIGRGAGLEFHLKSLAHLKLDNDVLGDSYSVVVHSPEVIPDMSEIMTIVPNNPLQLFTMSVSVNLLEVDDSLYKLADSVRGCTFANNLKGGRRRCQLDCRASTFLRYCQCLPYYLHSLRPEAVCGLQDLQCLSDISPRLSNTRVSEDSSGFPEWSLPLTMNCSCPQPCAYTSYTTELGDFSVPITGNQGSWTAVRVGYKTFAVKYSRTAKYVLRDFVVNCGSLAGLLLGFSVVAVFDLCVYFCRFIYMGLNMFNQNNTNSKFYVGNVTINHRRGLDFKRNNTSRVSNSSDNVDIKHNLRRKNGLVRVIPIHNVDKPVLPFVN